MTEEVLQHIWQYQILNQKGEFLQSVNGEKITVLDVGQKNYNQGPDFLNGRIKIDDIEWTGNVEIHLKSSLWNTHGHHSDPNYDNVILHVVLEDDKPVKRTNGEIIPCVELKNLLEESFLKRADDLILSNKSIPCESKLHEVRSIVKNSMLERVLIERIERKSNGFQVWFEQNNGDWEQTTFEIIAYCLGLKVNAQAFRDLAHSIDYKTILKHHDNHKQIESLFFGSAGFLEYDIEDEYHLSLKKEYQFLQAKYQIKRNLQRSNFKFSKMRPSNFPTVRISQLVEVFDNNRFLFSKLKESTKIEEIRSIFEITLNSYWKTHYDFGKTSKRELKGVGKSTLDIIIINGVVPLLYLYYKKTGNDEFLNRALFFLESINAENNSKINDWNNHFEIKTAYDSQSVLELHDYYCSQKKCLSCKIGCDIL